MENNYTIAESYTLPSKGRVYSQKVNPEIKIRSMTTEEEMKRLAHSDSPYKLLSEIIDDCLVEKPGISAYDMCIGDYQFLLHKLRIVTYGPDYKIETACPMCGNITKETINLESLNIVEYSEDFDNCLSINLPKTQKHLELKLQTPRMLDEISRKTKELLKKSPNMSSEPAILFTLQSVISTVDGEKYDSVKLESFIRRLPMVDTNYILKSLEKINLGIDTVINCSCNKCGYTHDRVFPITGEFFGPSID